MSQPRIQMSATILPNGKVLATGGSINDEDAVTASLNADLYDPATNTFSPAGANLFPRLYHSASLLLPDATVLLIGGNPQRGNYERRLEIYSPAYLFDANGTPRSGPPSPACLRARSATAPRSRCRRRTRRQIASVVLVRPGAPTHAFDMEQRLVGLSYTAGSGVLNVTAPPNGNIAPPGYYMLFVLNTAGVPSVARFVRLLPRPNQAPTATITSPAGNVTVNPGGSVSFAGTGSDPDGTISAYCLDVPWRHSRFEHRWPTPGTVTYSTPGTYTATFRVTDNRGLHERSPRRGRSRFRISPCRPHRRRERSCPGQSTSYTATVAPVNGFTGTVAFSVTGLPSGATATFNPASVTTSGSTTMSVSTSAATPPGSYPLTIRGTSGPRTRTVNVTLVVNGDFSISATPASRTITRGRRRHLQRDDYGRTGILRHGESLGERSAVARDDDVQSRVDRECRDLRADDRYRAERATANAHADDHGHRRWPGPLGQRDPDHSVGAMTISRRTLLRRLGAGAAAAVAAPSLARDARCRDVGRAPDDTIGPASRFG